VFSTVLLCDPRIPPCYPVPENLEMLMKITLNNISDNSFQKWNNFLYSHPHNTVFQSPEMYSFYEKVRNFTPYAFIAEDNQGEIVGVLLAVLIKEGKGLKGFFSSRVVVYGGPLISEDNKKPEVLNGLLQEMVSALNKKSIFIQFRNFFEWSDDEKLIFQKSGFSYRERLNLLVDTKDKKSTWSNISESRRRQIKKGLRSGAVIEDPVNENEVKEFYELLVQLYSSKVKKPLPGWSFFREFYNHSKKGQLGILKLVKKEGEVIGGILAPVTTGKEIYEWYITGLDNLYKSSYPSILATWAPIEYALENKLKYFDFMGLGLPQKEYGVRDFKLKFGNGIVNNGRFARRNNKQLYRLAEIGYNLLRVLKR